MAVTLGPLFQTTRTMETGQILRLLREYMPTDKPRQQVDLHRRNLHRPHPRATRLLHCPHPHPHQGRPGDHEASLRHSTQSVPSCSEEDRRIRSIDWRTRDHDRTRRKQTTHQEEKPNTRWNETLETCFSAYRGRLHAVKRFILARQTRSVCRTDIEHLPDDPNTCIIRRK